MILDQPMVRIGTARLRRAALPLVLLATAATVSACTDPYDPGQRAVGGGLIGAGAGAALGAIAGGGPGAAIGALAGGAVGAVGGAATTPYAGGGYAPQPAYAAPAPAYVQPTYVQPTYVAPAPVYAQPAYPQATYAPPGYAQPVAPGGYAY